MCSCESDKKFTFEHLSKKHNICSLYYRKLSANSPKGYLPATDDYSNCDDTIYCDFRYVSKSISLPYFPLHCFCILLYIFLLQQP